MSKYRLKPVHLLCLGSLMAIGYALGQVAPIGPVAATASYTSSDNFAIQKAALSEKISVQAGGRGGPEINLSDGREVLTAYEGPEELTRTLRQNSAQPLSLAAADFDEDGVPDLISGYAAEGSGIVTLLRGNVDSIFPNAPEARQRKVQGAFTESPFLSPARVFGLPQPPDFTGAGDFDADGHWDVVAAARGSNVLSLLRGDGHGSFASPVVINLPGAVTTLATGEVNRADSLDDVVVGIIAPDGPRLLVFEGPNGALKAEPETFKLPAEAMSVALGQLVDDYAMDIAVAAGNKLLIISGRDRKLSLDQASRAGVSEAKITRQSFSSAVKSVTAGDFTGNHENDLALLFDDGTVQLLSEKKHKDKKDKGWKSEALKEGPWPQAKQLVRVHVSSLPNDDLVLIDPANRRLQVLAAGTEARRRKGGEGVYASLDADEEPIAVLPMRLNVDALSDLVIIERGKTASVVVPTSPVATMTVTDTQDLDFRDSSITLREAILLANGTLSKAALTPMEQTQVSGTPGAGQEDAIIFSIGSGAQTINMGSSLPTITDLVTIDGTTQPAFVGSPLIVLNGSGAGGGANGLTISAGSSTVQGLVINGFSSHGIEIVTNGSNLVRGCFIGTNATGSSALGNAGDGVFIHGSPSNTIGGTSPGARNVISGNNIGAETFGFGSTNNSVQGNFIGTDAAGSADVGNTSLGVLVSSNSNTIGGTSAAARNIISGNNIGVALVSASSDQVLRNFIGTDVSGTADLGNGQRGVLIDDASNCTIGGTVPGAGNVISGNNGPGITFGAASPMHNDVVGNFIGTAVNGVDPLGNLLAGVEINSSFQTTIGGTSPGAGNIIAFNAAHGVLVNNGNAAILSNSIFSNVDIGIDLGGDGVTPNDGGDGDGGPNDLQNFPVLTFVNSIGGSTSILGSLNGTISTTYRVEFFSNITCDGSGNGEGQTFIGFTDVMTDGVGNAPINVVLAVSLTAGHVVTATATDSGNNTSEFSACSIVQSLSTTTFVVDSTGDNGDSNLGDMVCDDGTGHCTLRAAIEQANSNAGAQTINFNIPGAGVHTISPVGTALPMIADPVTIDGYTQPGSSVNSLPNGDNAILLIELNGSGVGAGHGLTVAAGNSTVQGLVINRFVGKGISVDGDGIQIKGCFIGTNATGTADLGNGMSGVSISHANNNTIGGTSPGARNILSGNDLNGVEVHGPNATGNQVLGNFIGTDVSASIALGNANLGVQIDSADGNSIGGTSAGARNIISGNSADGVKLENSANNQISGNFIGVDVSGTVALGNGLRGVFLVDSPFCTIGGTAAGAGNVISGNAARGIDIFSAGTTGTLVQGNFIGTDVSGSVALGNGIDGVLVNKSLGNTIGGAAAGAGNIIAGNIANGVLLLESTSLILSNSIFSNGALGIDLNGDGITPNDAGDGDAGPNSLQNFPLLTSANSFGGSTTIAGSLNSTASTNFRVEFFSNPACDGSGNGEGQTFIGFTAVMTDGGGNAAIDVDLPVSLTAGTVVTATATNTSTNETSEFSSCIVVTANPGCTINCPANVPVSAASGQCTALVNYPAPTTGGSCGTVNCSPPSGSVFAKGTTLVGCSTTAGPNCSFNVTVNDTEAPVVSCPANIHATAPPNQASVVVNYSTPIPSDNCTGTTVVCSPPSLSNFPVGATTVNCTATDSSGNTGLCSFSVIVGDASILSINDVSVVEGNAGTATAVFTVTLSPAAASPVTVNFATADGSANAGSDYLSNAGTLTFDPGQTSKSISVLVTGDVLNEGDETFFVNLSGATNAVIVDGQGAGKVINDDGAPGLSISDVSVIEGNSGFVSANFVVTLSPVSGSTVTVNFVTADGTATVANADYVARSGLLTFASGETNKTISVQVTGDTSQEPDEIFQVLLSGATNAGILDGVGVGTIVNDEAPIAADLSVTVTVAESVNSGEQLAYLISVRNAGPRLATNVTVLDSIQGDTTFSSASADRGLAATPGAGTSAPVTWALSSLAPGEGATLELVVNVLALAGTTLVNTATATSLSADPNPVNNTQTAFTAVEGGGVIELAWEQPGSNPVNPTPAPTNVRVEDNASASGTVSSSGVRASAAVCALIGFKVYLSPRTPVEITDANLWRSDLPADVRKVSLPALPAGTFYSVVAVWNCEGTTVDSPPSNEAEAPPQPEVKKIKVTTSKIKVVGSRFQKGLEVSVLLGGAQSEVKFEARAAVKKNGTQVIQRGKLTNGMTIEQLVRSGNAKLVLRNPDGGKVTIALPGLPISP